MRVYITKILGNLAFVSSLILPTTLYAAYWDGYKLKEMFDAYDRADNGRPLATDYQDVGQVNGFVVGVHDSVEGTIICVPAKVKLGQLVGIVKKYIRDNPEKWNEPASDLVMQALSSTFPCKR